MNYRITEIGGWFRVRDENNEELGQGNSVDIAVTRAINDLRAKLEDAEKKAEARGLKLVGTEAYSRALEKRVDALENTIRQIDKEKHGLWFCHLCKRGNDCPCINDETCNFEYNSHKSTECYSTNDLEQINNG